MKYKNIRGQVRFFFHLCTRQKDYLAGDKG